MATGLQANHWGALEHTDSVWSGAKPARAESPPVWEGFHVDQEAGWSCECLRGLKFIGGQVSAPWKERSLAVRATEQRNERPPNIMSQTQLRFFLPDYSCHLCAAMAGCRAHPRLFLGRMILPEHLQKDMPRSSSREAEDPPPKSRVSSSFWSQFQGRSWRKFLTNSARRLPVRGSIRGKVHLSQYPSNKEIDIFGGFLLKRANEFCDVKAELRI